MEKIHVGFREGDTENSEVVKDLLASLQERGFTLHCERLLAVVRERILRVKNWKARCSNQILRWVASSILAHRKKMHHVRGMAQAKELIVAQGPKHLAVQAA
jgi:hypothetical protein